MKKRNQKESKPTPFLFFLYLSLISRFVVSVFFFVSQQLRHYVPLFIICFKWPWLSMWCKTQTDKHTYTGPRCLRLQKPRDIYLLSLSNPIDLKKTLHQAIWKRRPYHVCDVKLQKAFSVKLSHDMCFYQIRQFENN